MKIIMTSLLFALMLFSGAQLIIAGDHDNTESTDKETTGDHDNTESTDKETTTESAAYHKFFDVLIEHKDEDPGPSEPAPEKSTAENSAESKLQGKLMDIKKNHPEWIKKMKKKDVKKLIEEEHSRTQPDHVGKPTSHVKSMHVDRPKHQSRPRQQPQRKPDRR